MNSWRPRVGFPGGVNPGIFMPVLFPPSLPLHFLDPELPSAAPITLRAAHVRVHGVCVLREQVCTRREVTVLDAQRL